MAGGLWDDAYYCVGIASPCDIVVGEQLGPFHGRHMDPPLPMTWLPDHRNGERSAIPEDVPATTIAEAFVATILDR